MEIKSLIFFGVFFLFASCFSQAQAQVNANNFGDESFKLIKQGKYTLSCSDAKYFAVLAETAMKDMGTHDKPSQKLKNFEDAMSKLEKFLKEFIASKDADTTYKIKKELDDKISGLFSRVLDKISGQAEDRKVNEYLNITFCGVKSTKDGQSIKK